MLPIDLPDNELTEQMTGQPRADNARRLLLSLLVKMPDQPARLTAPPSGLFLDRVYYSGDLRDPPLGAVTPLS